MDDNNDFLLQHSDHLLHLRIAFWDRIKSDNRHHSAHGPKHTRGGRLTSFCPGMVYVSIF